MKTKVKKTDDTQLVTGMVEACVSALLRAREYINCMNKKEQKEMQVMLDESLMEFISAKYFT